MKRFLEQNILSRSKLLVVIMGAIFTPLHAAEAAIVKATLAMHSDISSPLKPQCDSNQDASLDEAEFMNFYRLGFARDDQNGDGVISASEMGITVILPKNSTPAPTWAMAEFKALAFQRRDKDADGLISWQETAENLPKGFRQLDRDGNGRLSKSELGAAFSSCFAEPAVRTAALQ